MVANRKAATERDLCGKQAMPADRHIVADLDLVVDFGAFADNGVAQAAAVDGGSGADFNVVLDQNARGLRYLHMAAGSKNESITVLSNMAAPMDHDIVAGQRELATGA